MAENENMELDLDKPAQKTMLGEFVNKADLVQMGRTLATITGFGPGKFKHPLIGLQINGNNYQMDFNNKQKNALIDMFGGTPRSWIGKSIYLDAKEGKFKLRDSDEEVEGIEVTFLKV